MLLAVNTTILLLQLRSLYSDSAVIGDGTINGYIVPLGDAHNGERVANCDKRLNFISGFSGSAGFAFITTNSALLWTDGRYFTQADQELDGNWELMRQGVPGTPTLGEYIIRNMTTGSRIGVDPSLYSKSTWDKLQTEIAVGGQSLVLVRRNLIDLVWGDQRPPCPANPLMMLSFEFTGKESSEKLQDVRNAVVAESAEAVVISELDEIAWLLNLRGSDLDSSSVFISYLILTNSSFELFIDPLKLNEAISSYISNLGGTVNDYQNVTTGLQSLVESSNGKVWFSETCNYALVSLVPANRQIIKLGPISLLKAVKNPVEVDGMKNALIRDAAAVSKFLRWIENEMENGETVSELSASEHLLNIRKENEHFITTSFNTISATGANGAIIHYRPTEASNTNLTKENMYLVDSGAIYMDGTTDITRTVHFGTPTDFQRECYTRVLKGQIALATTVFPRRTVGSRVDSFARRALWNVGLDYGHGTGHGIGHALNVHEGPSAIKERHVPEDQGFRENMFTSNEPGYYEVDQFGIRLENIVRVVNVTLPHNFQSIGFIGFEDLTFVPYQRKLIKLELLTSKEIDYLNNYQEKVRSIVGEFIRQQDSQDPTYDWIIKETQPIV